MRGQSNEGWAGKTGGGETWAQFDALPRGVKRLYWHAPYLYTALEAVRAMATGHDLQSQVAKHTASMERDVQRETARIYGANHPQADGSISGRIP